MKKLFSALFAWLRSTARMDRNELTYWSGLLMLFAGLTWCASMPIALTVVGAGMAIEGVITSYMAAWFGSRK